MKKINGFTRSPHILQIISYIIFFGNVAVFSFVIMPFCDLMEKVFLSKKHL